MPFGTAESQVGYNEKNPNRPTSHQNRVRATLKPTLRPNRILTEPRYRNVPAPRTRSAGYANTPLGIPALGWNPIQLLLEELHQ